MWGEDNDFNVQARASRIFFRTQSMIWGSKSAALYCMRKGLLVISISRDSQWLMHEMIKWSSETVFNFNTLWPSDAITWHRSVLALARITACCWWQQAITWTNVDLSSVRSTEICLWSISWEIPQLSITKIVWNYLSNSSFKSPRVPMS